MARAFRVDELAAIVDDTVDAPIAADGSDDRQRGNVSWGQLSEAPVLRSNADRAKSVYHQADPVASRLVWVSVTKEPHAVRVRSPRDHRNAGDCASVIVRLLDEMQGQAEHTKLMCPEALW